MKHNICVKEIIIYYVIFCGQVLGLCGNNDNFKDNDFMGRNRASMSCQEFIQLYSCRNAMLFELAQRNQVSRFQTSTVCLLFCTYLWLSIIYSITSCVSILQTSSKHIYQISIDVGLCNFI